MRSSNACGLRVYGLKTQGLKIENRNIYKDLKPKIGIKNNIMLAHI